MKLPHTAAGILRERRLPGFLRSTHLYIGIRETARIKYGQRNSAHGILCALFLLRIKSLRNTAGVKRQRQARNRKRRGHAVSGWILFGLCDSPPKREQLLLRREMMRGLILPFAKAEPGAPSGTWPFPAPFPKGQ